MSYLIRRVLAKPRLILDEMCRLYGKFASYFSSYKWPYCSVDGKGYSKGRNFSCDHEALFAGQHEEPEVDVSEFQVESVTPSWNKIYTLCGLGYLSVNQKKAFLGALWGWGNRLLM